MKKSVQKELKQIVHYYNEHPDDEMFELDSIYNDMIREGKIGSKQEAGNFMKEFYTGNKINCLFGHVSNDVKQYLADIGRKGGHSTSEAKQRASRENGSKPCAPGKKRGRPRRGKDDE